MIRFRVRLAYLAILLLLAFSATGLHAQPQPALRDGVPIGPGVGGQVHAFAFDPQDTNVAYAGGDVCGVYKYDRGTHKWSPWSAGLGFNEFSQAYYVDDLLVVRESTEPGAPDMIDDGFEGVYAATRGGVFFRRIDGAEWECITPGNTYIGGYSRRVFAWGPYEGINTVQRIPFSSLAFDSLAGVLYAGAGSARMSDGTTDDYYPNAFSDATPEYSLWSVDLTTTSRVVSAVTSSDGHGYVRQVAVATFQMSGAPTSRVVYACDHGVASHNPSVGTTDLIWTPTSPNKVGPPGYADDPWGVAAGQNGIIYAAMSRHAQPPLWPGIWEYSLVAGGGWTAKIGDNQLRLADGSLVNWTAFVTDDPNHRRNLSELSVFVGPTGEDEIYIGIGTNGSNADYGDCGYLRYGTYMESGSPPVARTGWAFIHQTVGDGAARRIHVVDWRHGAVRSEIIDDDVTGWQLYYPSLRALVPFAIHPANPDVMVAIDYHVPMVTTPGGWHWRNLYCTGSFASGWRNTGLNLLCTRSDGFLSDGRLLIGAADVGVFCATDPSNRWFRPLHIATTVGSPLDFPAALDIETTSYAGAEEIYMVEGYSPSSDAGIYVWTVDEGWPSGQNWLEISGGDAPGGIREAIGASSSLGMAISAMAMPSPTTAFAAAAVVSGPSGSETYHYYICEGTRGAGSHQWSWQVRYDCEPGPNTTQTRMITDLCLIPGTTRIAFGAKMRNQSRGGVFVADYSVLDASSRWYEPAPWLGGSLDAPGSDFDKLSRNVTALEADPSGTYLYVGSSSHDSAGYPSYGGLTRIEIGPGGSYLNRTVLSGPGSDWHFPMDSREFYPVGMTINGYTAIPAWGFAARVTDMAVAPTDPTCVFVAVNNKSYHDDQTGVWYYNGNDGTWDHLWGGGESGSGAVTVGVHPSQPNKLYIGSVGQEFFAVDVETAPRPTIATTAEYPFLANTTGPAHAFAVRITSASPIDSASVDLSSIGGPVLALRDATGGEDALAGDGVFTTEARFAATLAFGQTYSATVYAVAQDGRYSRRNVAVEVVGGTAKFVDKSEFTGDLVNMLPESTDTLPYAAIYFNTATDGAGLDAMIVTIDDNTSTPLMLQRADFQNGAPVFSNRSPGGEVAWLEENLPSGSRGICSSDYDRSAPSASAGNTDFFICNPMSGGQLYRGTVVSGQPRFVAMEGILAGQDAVAGAVTAQWGDYNRDGFDDLAIATANYTQPVKSISGAGPFSSGLKILKNVGGSRFDQSVNSYSMGPNICLSMAWVNLDRGTPGDRGLDLVTWNYLDTGTVFWENLGHNELVNDTYVAPGHWSINDVWRGGMSVNDLDFDHDGDRDLLVTEARGFRRAMVLRNNLNPVGNVATGTKSFDTFGLAHDRDWTGAVVGSFDTQPSEDVLLLPSEGQPALFMNVGPQAPGTYRDLAFTLGLRGGATSGALAADFDGAGSTDLFLGRTRTDEFLYSNVGPDGTQALQRSLRVNLDTAGSSGRALLGTVVAVTADGVTHTKVVNAGAGRGGQAPRDVLFTLGDFAGSSVTVTVTYPSREVDTFPVTLNGPLTTVTAIENQAVVIKAGTRTDPEPDFSYHLDPGHMEWIFRWRTEGVRGDITKDVVRVENVNYDENDDCYIGIPLGATRDLKLGDPDVVHNVYWDGSNWQHEVRWTGLPCATGCIYRFTVSSGIGASVTSSQPPKSTTPTSYCIPDDVNPGQ